MSMTSKKNPTVYLGGLIDGTTWRNAIKDDLDDNGVRCICPITHDELFMVNDKHCINPSKTLRRMEWDINRCDAVIINVGNAIKISITAVTEMAFAYQRKKPIVLVMPPNNVHDHLFFYEMAWCVIDDVTDIVPTITDIFDL